MGLSLINRRLGGYLLGSTAPDRRIITGVSRQDTHFVDLNSETGEVGVNAFFGAYPHLRQANLLDEANRAFVAGYLSHLITDGLWISQVYRPLFAAPSSFGEAASVMDRALQFEMDRRERLRDRDMEVVREAVCSPDLGIAVDFIDGAVLEEWRAFVCSAANRRPSWEGFRSFAKRYLYPQGKAQSSGVEAFLDAFPSSLESLLCQVSEERLAAFRERAIADSQHAAEEYLE